MVLTCVDAYRMRKLGHYSGCYSHRVILFSCCFLFFLFSRNCLQYSDTGKIGSLLTLRILLISFDLNNMQSGLFGVVKFSFRIYETPCVAEINY